ncbi:chemotaxis protein CheW [Pseudoduganella namucuonensis]|uniref:Chemotaxis protein CheW n=1 Tax=Pseudoduganella namucuonensis TaxID=1035707 RepID=A0A1I7JLN0_9BURK|nr:chemotaxis protein CheW [Pseudoduganella namucuonensis]SFU86066.1 purine-binding chemotaxis protein CheW [Pseudoduganella namucuonensis]
MQSATPIGAQETAPRQYLSFRLGGLEYALDYRKVRELRPLNALERISEDGEIIGGVAVSRGLIMPIVDMRIAFGPRPPQHDPRTDVIILQLSTCVMGMVTDGVTDVVTLAEEKIQPMPGLAKEVDYLLGIGETPAGRRLIVVDIDKLMAIRRAGRGALHAA